MTDKKKPEQPPEEPKAQPDPRFDKAGNCTNYSDPTTCPRTPENPGGHHVPARDKEAHAAAQKARDDAIAAAIAAEAEEAPAA